MSSIYGYYGSNITSASSSSSSSTSLGISGLVSGLDIDSTVEAMCSGTQSKITKVQQNLMKLEWKQEAYQDVGTALTDFKDKYLSSSSSTNISTLLSNCYKIESQGDNASAVSASGSTNILSNFSILGVSSLATNASFTSKSGLTNNAITTNTLNISSEEADVSLLEGKKFSFKVGSTSYSLEMGSEVITDADSAAAALNAAIAEYDNENDNGSGSYTSLASKISVGVSDGKLTLSSTDSSSLITISSSSNSTVLKALGFEPTTENGTKRYANAQEITSTGIDSSSATTKQSFFSKLTSSSSLTLDLDGVKGTVNFGDSYVSTGQTVAEYIQDAGDTARTAYQTEHADDADVDTQAEAAAQKAMLSALATEMNTQLSKSFGSKVEVTANDDGSLSFATTVNNSVLSVSSASSGLCGDSGIFSGLEVGSANRLLLNKSLEENNMAVNSTTSAFDFGDEVEKTYTNTEGKSITVTDSENTYDMSVNGVSFSIGRNSITVDGKTTEYSNGVTMNNIMSAINSSSAGVRMSYLSTTDRFTISSTASGAVGSIDISGSLADMIFGDGTEGSGTVGEVTTTDADGNTTTETKSAGGNLTKGTDASLLVSFDGKTVEEITRSTNSFKLDGLSLSLTGTFNTDKTADSFTDANSIANCDGAITFSKTIDSDELIDALKTMTDDYNSLIDKVKDYYTTKSDSDYQPLTSSMVKDEDLTDDQAELYNNKAKEGILFGDTILRSLSDDLRTIFSGMSSIGITTSSDYSEYGKLTFNATTLKSALESDSQSVIDKFTTDKTGILDKLDSLMDKYVNSSLASPGLITAKSGLASSSLSQMTCTMYSEQESLEDQLESLQDKLETQQDRYYDQFTNMEVELNNIMSQSSYLSSLSY